MPLSFSACTDTLYKKKVIFQITNFFAGQREGQFVDILHWYKVCHPKIPLFNFFWICLNLQAQWKHED